MILTINEKDFSFSPDTLTAVGNKPLCNILIHPKEQLLLLKPNTENKKDAIDISLLPSREKLLSQNSGRSVAGKTTQLSPVKVN